MKFRFHVLGLPHTRTTEEFVACAYTQKVLKFCKMMHERGHYIIHYGTAGSNPICDENVEVLSEETFQEVYGDHDFRSKWFKFSTDDPAYQEFYRRGIEELGKRKQKNDFILPFWGSGTRPICDAHEDDCIVVEPGIGYSGGHWARWKVFESHALLHAYRGIGSVARCNMDWYETVIPNYFDLKDFERGPDKRDDYMLFVGRVYDGKGLNIAVQVTEELGVKLKVAGQLDTSYENYEWPDHVEFVGYVDVDQRKELMSKAMGSYVPSMYIEPFGGVQIENLLCGTPTITTDWGAFAENNIEGVTGYRCRSFRSFVEATKKVMNGEIDYDACRKHGEKFSLEAVAPRYEEFFRDVMNVYTGRGWYEMNDPDPLHSVKASRPHLVVSRYNEDVSWLKDFGCNYTIYNKGEDDLDLPCVKKENKGREGGTFLDHIIENYDQINSPVAFLQGDPFDHFKQSSMTSKGTPLHGLDVIKNDEALKELIHNFRSGVTLLGRPETCDGNGMPWFKGLNVDGLAERIGVKQDSYLICPGAQYVVSEDRIKSKSLDWWKNLRDAFYEDEHLNGHILERLWFAIYNKDE